MAKKKYRPRGVQLIQACDWCGGAFATRTDDGMFCTPVCRLDFNDHKRQVERKRLPTMTVGELIDMLDDQRGD